MRNTDINKAFFPVEMLPLQCQHPSLGAIGSQVTVPRHKAVVDLERGEVFAVVTTNYRLVTNREAMDIGCEAWAAVFRKVDLGAAHSWDVFNVVMPAKRGHCFIDLIHASYRVDVLEQDFWLPFIRITNSYNKTRALRFDLGFVRSLCSNGIIFKNAMIRYKEPHTTSRIQDKIRFPVAPDWFDEMQADFIHGMKTLRAIPVPDEFDQALMAKALGLTFDDVELDARNEQDRRRLKVARDRRSWFKALAGDLIRRYQKELSNDKGRRGALDAYVILNAATDFAKQTHDHSYLPFGMDIDRMQRSVGGWTDDLNKARHQPGFSFESYLGPLVRQLSIAA